MRISTSTAYDRGTAEILRQNVDLNKTLLQIATGKRILTPSDDPADAARILDLNQQEQRTVKFQDNIKVAEANLEIEDITLKSIVDLLQRVRELSVQGSNDTYDADQRGAIALEVNQLNDSLLGYANAVNGQGEYLFSGHAIDTVPFQVINDGANENVKYFGDQGQKNIKIGASRQIASGNNGYDVFMDTAGVFGNDLNLVSGPTKVSLFKVVSDIGEALATNAGPNQGPAPTTATPPESFHEAMQRGLDNLDAALGQILDVQATIGARLNAIDSQKGANADFLIQVETTKSEVQDLDYAAAISRLELEQLGLQASQQSFTQIHGLSLFNYI
jgi:flagellar hook-associated protein 3 FlgL